MEKDWSDQNVLSVIAIHRAGTSGDASVAPELGYAAELLTEIAIALIAEQHFENRDDKPSFQFQIQTSPNEWKDVDLTDNPLSYALIDCIERGIIEPEELQVLAGQSTAASAMLNAGLSLSKSGGCAFSTATMDFGVVDGRIKRLRNVDELWDDLG